MKSDVLAGWAKRPNAALIAAATFGAFELPPPPESAANATRATGLAAIYTTPISRRTNADCASKISVVP
jgi:hypothetical protein